jgi:hypothetical protein
MRRIGWLAAVLLSAGAARAEEASVEPAVPLLHHSWGNWSLEAPISIATRGEYTTGFPVDAAGSDISAGWTLSPRLRLGLRVDSGAQWASTNLHFEYEQDVPTGTVDFRRVPAGVGMPDSGGFDFPLRKAFVRASFKAGVFVQVGVTTNHWGLGLVANDGAHGWEPGSALFTDPRGGDRVLRAMLGSLPLTEARIVATVGGDRVLEDPTLLWANEMLPNSGAKDDTAWQVFGAVIFNYAQPSSAGVYLVQRWQNTSDGRFLNATVLDATGTLNRAIGHGTTMQLATELAWVSGTTNLSGTPTNPTQIVDQLGAVLRAAFDFGRVGTVLDLVYASGDQNVDDGGQNGFRANTNFDEGLLLFKQVLAGQTARAPITASSPSLVGDAPTGLERFPTRGAVTNTVTIFPRLWGRPAPNLEIYGGPLFAFADVAQIDPFNTLIAGGVSRNALNGVPGNYFGTECDLGIRYHVHLASTALSVGVEGGAFLPGTAFREASGQLMGSVYGGRVMLDYWL